MIHQLGDIYLPYALRRVTELGNPRVLGLTYRIRLHQKLVVYFEKGRSSRLSRHLFFTKQSWPHGVLCSHVSSLKVRGGNLKAISWKLGIEAEKRPLVSMEHTVACAQVTAFETICNLMSASASLCDT